MGIIEKLGITPIQHPGTTHMEVIRDLENQRNELLGALVELVDDMYELSSRRKYEKIIQNIDPQHRSWEEIKAL